MPNKNILKRMIILCWVILGICFIVKIFGGNFFQIVVSNDRFIKLCDFIDNTFLYYIVQFCSYYAISIIIMSIMNFDKKFTRNQLIILSIVIIVCFILQNIVNMWNEMISSIIFTLIRYVLVPLIVLKSKILMVVIVNVVDIIFQLISMFIKDLGIGIFPDNSLIAIIFLIDYYIMLILFLLYVKYYKKE